jgi:hypothetical protein
MKDKKGNTNNKIPWKEKNHKKCEKKKKCDKNTQKKRNKKGLSYNLEFEIWKIDNLVVILHHLSTQFKFFLFI